MAKRDPIKTLRDLLVMEVRNEKPSFAIMRHLQSALQDALKRENRLSVDDVESSFNTMGSGIVIHGNNIYEGEDEGTEGAMPRGRPRFKESQTDQMLSALDQMVARTGADPLVPVVQAVPYMEILYPDADKREATLGCIRREIEGRLASEPPHAVEGREEQTS